MDSNTSADHKDLSSALLHIEVLQKQLAENNTEREEQAKVNDMNKKLSEWITLGKDPRPGPDVLNRLSELRIDLQAFIETTLKAKEPAVI
jgi:hypothetical protein